MVSDTAVFIVLVLDKYFDRGESRKSNCSDVVFPWFLYDPVLSLVGLLAVTLSLVISAPALGFIAAYICNLPASLPPRDLLRLHVSSLPAFMR